MTVDTLRAAALTQLEARDDLSSLLTPEKIASLRELFQRVDTDDDGQVTSAEIGDFLDEGVALDEGATFEFEALLQLVAQREFELREEQAWNTFSHFDVDADGFVDRNELARLTNAGASSESVAALLADADGDGDGRIDYEEFLAWYCGLS